MRKVGAFTGLLVWSSSADGAFSPFGNATRDRSPTSVPTVAALLWCSAVHRNVEDDKPLPFWRVTIADVDWFGNCRCDLTLFWPERPHGVGKGERA